MIATGRLRPPRDVDRALLHRQLLEHHRIRRLVRGRGPLLHAELVAMVMTTFSLSRGMSEAAIARAIDAGDVVAWISLPVGGEPDPDAVLGALEAEADQLEQVRRAAREAPEG